MVLGTHLHNKNRIIYYCAIVLICSLYDAPETFKINKSNILNQWFVKLGWLWTLLVLIPLQFASLNDADKEGVSSSIFKIVTSSIFWYISVNLFQYLDDKTGFDISGHTFLLIFSNLILCSELYFAKHRRLSSSHERSTKDAGDSRKANQSLLAPYIPKILADKSMYEVSNISVIVISALWDFMLIQTSLFYHTFIQKFIALVWAVGAWYLLHLTFNTAQPLTTTAQTTRQRAR